MDSNDSFPNFGFRAAVDGILLDARFAIIRALFRKNHDFADLIVFVGVLSDGGEIAFNYYSAEWCIGNGPLEDERTKTRNGVGINALAEALWDVPSDLVEENFGRIFSDEVLKNPFDDDGGKDQP